MRSPCKSCSLGVSVACLFELIGELRVLSFVVLSLLGNFQCLIDIGSFQTCR